MRILFMGTSEFAVPSLRTLILAGYDISLVVTQPDRPAGRGKHLQAPPVKAVAEEFGLDCIQPVSIRDKEVQEQLASQDPEVIVVVAYGKILPREVLTIPVLGCVNLHGSLLPAYRGAAPIQRSLMEGEETVGVTTILMDENMDTGDILLQKKTKLQGDEDYGETSRRLALEGADLLLETLEQMEWGSIPRVRQSNELATYAPPLTRGDELIKWDLDNGKIRNQIRGLAPTPAAYTRWRKTKLKIYRAGCVPSDGGVPGEVTAIIPGEGFVVQTGNGGLLVQEIQREGKNRMSAGEFLKGTGLKPGELLGEED